MAGQHGGWDVSAQLAARLAMAPLEFVDIFGAAWRPVEVVGEESVAADAGSQWFVSGDPVQLMLRVYPHGVFLARPEGVWHHGAGGLAYRQRDQVFVDLGGIHDLDRLREMIDRLVRLRRTTFGYCRCCRKIVGPELLSDAHTCQDCVAIWRDPGAGGRSESVQTAQHAEPLS